MEGGAIWGGAVQQLYLMRKLYKLLSISNISIQLDEAEAKDISRVRLRIFEDGDPTRKQTTKFYADIRGQPQTLTWPQNFQFRFKDQTKVTFETECEHEYGYELEELQVLWKGVYWIRNEMFFRPDSCHIYNQEGEKKGVLKWQIKVVTKEQEQVQEQAVEREVSLVRQDLIGLIKINNASLEIINPIFNKKRHGSMQLLVRFDEFNSTYQTEHDYKWQSLNAKLQFVEEGGRTIYFQLIQECRIILDGTIQCQQIQKRKRYISHKVTMFNKNGIKIGFLNLDLRYLTKQELLDLIYSPSNKLNYSDSCTERSASSDALYPQFLPNLGKTSKKGGQSLKKHIFMKEDKILPSHRYKIGYLMNHNNDILFPKANRFAKLKASNQNISYINPQKSSDFSPKKSHGANGMSRGSKFDFTRQYKHNPGVGEYQLPSIWSKY